MFYYVYYVLRVIVEKMQITLTWISVCVCTEDFPRRSIRSFRRKFFIDRSGCIAIKIVSDLRGNRFSSQKLSRNHDSGQLIAFGSANSIFRRNNVLFDLVSRKKNEKVDFYTIPNRENSPVLWKTRREVEWRNS